jgi:hypothetical protein
MGIGNLPSIVGLLANPVLSDSDRSLRAFSNLDLDLAKLCDDLFWREFLRHLAPFLVQTLSKPAPVSGGRVTYWRPVSLMPPDEA